tara:strand:+ start:535 stop:861 length:327 start_codon:yes stop_codon:yes gene_type:complete
MSESENAWSKNIIVKKEKEAVIIKKEKEYQYSKEEKLFKALYKLKQQQKKEAFQDWLEKITYEDIRIRDLLMQMVSDVKDEINKAGFLIKDENQLKNNIATFIYNNSK